MMAPDRQALFSCITDLPDTKENVKLKHYLITKLPQAPAVECYKVWGHSSCQSFLAYSQVAEILAGKLIHFSCVFSLRIFTSILA